MSKVLIASLFTFIIITVVTIPTVITIAESSCEVSSFFDSGEDEDKQGKESIKNHNIDVITNHYNDVLFAFNQNSKLLDIYSKSYNSVYRLTYSPPPEQNS